jgi:hypothetical protein
MTLPIPSSAQYSGLLGALDGLVDEGPTLFPSFFKIKKHVRYSSTRIDIYPAKGRKIVEIQVATTKTKQRFISLDLYPSKFAAEEFQVVQGAMVALLDVFTYTAFWLSGKVSYIELTCDLYLPAMHTFIPFMPRTSQSSVWTEKDGTKGSITLGSPESARRLQCYDKGLLNQLQGKDEPHRATRVELRLRRTGRTLAQLAVMPNPIAAVALADLERLKALDPGARYQTFLAACCAVGSPAALAQLSKHFRKKYANRLKGYGALWWKPDYVWSRVLGSLTGLQPT